MSTHLCRVGTTAGALQAGARQPTLHMLALRVGWPRPPGARGHLTTEEGKVLFSSGSR